MTRILSPRALIFFSTLLSVTACGGSEDSQEESTGASGGASGSGGGSSTGAKGSMSPPVPHAPTIAVEDFESTCLARDHERCFYVSNSGNVPEGTEARQLSINEISSREFLPGDIILFARGDTFRQQEAGYLFSISSSGTEENYITFSAFGEGDNPRLFGSTALTSWTNTSDNLWQSNTNVPLDPSEIDSGAQVFFEHPDSLAFFGHHEDNDSGLDREGDWTWTGGQITVFSSENPGTRYASVEAPQTERLIALNDQQYVAFDSLTLRYMVGAGIYDEYGNAAGLLGLRVTATEIAYIGVKNSSSAYGLSLERSGIYVGGSDIHDCGRRGISLVLYETEASVIRDVIIENNHFHHGYHTTGIDIQSNSARSGSHLIEDITIRNNLFASDPSYDIGGEDGNASNLIFTNEDEGSTLRSLYIYGNVFMYAPGSGIKTQGGSGYFIHHNTFYGFNHSYDNYQSQIFGGDHAENTVIANNIFVNDAPDSRYACIEFSAGQEAEYEIDNNLYFTAGDAHARLLWVDGGTSHFFDDDFESYRSETGFDANSPIPADPLFIEAPTNLGLKGDSPAIGVAEGVDWINVDQAGNALSSPADLGAFQSVP